MKSKALSFDEITAGIDKVISNAEDLVEDARVLLAAGRVARAFTLSHLAREELAKVPMMCRVGIQVLAGIPSDWAKFWKRFRDHKEKLRVDTVAQVTALAWRFGECAPELLAAAMPAAIDAKNDRKNYSLYVSFTASGFVAPRDVISRHAAERAMFFATRTLLDAQWYAATLKTLATTPQERVRATFLALEARLQDFDPTQQIDALLKVGVALHQIAPGVADALDDELDSTSMPAGPDQHDNVSAEDAEPGPG
jgi:AbiV family abortive infection protein